MRATGRPMDDLSVTFKSAAAAAGPDLKQALEQKTALLHEVDHRVKNNLQLIAALLLLQARQAKEPAVSHGFGKCRTAKIKAVTVTLNDPAPITPCRRRFMKPCSGYS